MRKSALPVAGLSLIAVGLVGISAVLFCSSSAGPFSEMTGGGMDAMFIEQMIPHHDDAIEMADLALTRAEHPEIRQLAVDIKRTQTAENAQMRSWYQDWFGAPVPDVDGSPQMMGSGMMGGAMDIADLEDAESFDKAFIEAMIPHHQTGIMMSRMAGGATDRSELRQLTSNIIATQNAEIDKMQVWYDEWYGR